MTTAFLKPKAGLQIKDPDTRDILPAEGKKVTLTSFWLRRIRAGDVTQIDGPEPIPYTFNYEQASADLRYLFEQIQKSGESIVSLSNQSAGRDIACFVGGLSSDIVRRPSLQALWQSSEKAFASKSIEREIIALSKQLADLSGRLEKTPEYAPKEMVASLLAALSQLGSRAASGEIVSEDVELTTDQVKALYTTPVTLLTSLGGGHYTELVSVEFLKPSGTAYAGIDPSEKLSIEYATSGVIMQADATGFLDQTSEERRPLKVNASIAGLDEAIILKLLVSDITTGDSPLKCRLRYRVCGAIS